MEIITKLKILSYIYKYSAWLFLINRAIFRSNLTSAGSGLFLLLGYASLLIMINIDSSYMHIFVPWHEVILSISFCPLLIICGYLLLGQYCSGVVKIDCGAETGISFKHSINLCTKSFRFLGVGASKLTKEEEVFRAMASRCITNRNPPKLLLCNPQSPVTKELEGLAKVPSTRFSGNIKKSYAALQAMEEELCSQFEIKQYYAKKYDNMPLFRLIFIDDEYCLVSGGDYGKADHGVKISQFLVKKSKNAAFYKSLDKYFWQVWEATSTTYWDRESY